MEIMAMATDTAMATVMAIRNNLSDGTSRFHKR